MPDALEHYLEAADGAGKLVAHARLLLKLSRLYREFAPEHLCQASSPVNYKAGTVVIHADNGAVAAKLRQMAPSLSGQFSRRGVECNGLQIKVQAREIPSQSIPSTQKPLGAGAVVSLEGLQGTLPDSPLRTAIRRLLEKSAKSG